MSPETRAPQPVDQSPTAIVPPAELAERLSFVGGRGLRRHTARGTLINAAFMIGLNGLALLKGFVVAGLLTTSEYGVWGILVITIGTFVWLKQLGIGDKYVQQDEEDQELAFQKAFTLELMLSGAFVALLLAALPLMALVYGRPELVLPGVVFVLMILGTSLAAPTWIFYRKMDYLKQRLLQAIEPVVAFVVTIALAIGGAGYWSLVIGVFAGAWTAGIVAVAASPYRLALRYDRGTMREYFAFTWPVLIMAASGLVVPQLSILLGEAEVGLAGVGAMALAATISQFADRVDFIVTATLYPAICAVKERTELLFETFVKSNRLCLMWAVPFGAALTLFAPDLVEFGIGSEWEPAVLLLQVFGLTAAANHIGFNWHAYYRARDETRPLAVVSVVTMIAFLAVPVPLLFSHGLNGFALGIGAMTATAIVARTFYLVRLFPGFRMAKHGARAIAPTIPAVAVVLGLRALETSERSLGLALAELALYLAVTVAATVVFERALLREVVSYLRPAPATEPSVAS